MRAAKTVTKQTAQAWNLEELLRAPGETPQSIWKQAVALVRHRRIREWENAYSQTPELQAAFRQTLKEIDWDLSAEQVVTAYDNELATEIKQGLSARHTNATKSPATFGRWTRLPPPPSSPPQPNANPWDVTLREGVSRSPSRTLQPTVKQQPKTTSVIVIDDTPSLEDVIREYLDKQKKTDIAYKEYFAMVRQGRDLVMLVRNSIDV
jgi:hypothetical protein